MHVVALVLAAAVAFAAFVAFAWFELGFWPLAVLALVTFLVAAYWLLRLSMRLAGVSDSAAPGKVARWLVGGTAIYVLLAQLAVGRSPARTLQPPEPVPGTQYWLLSDGARLAYSVTPARGTPRDTPVIWLHGGPGEPILPTLQRLGIRPLDYLASDGFAIYYYDQLGAGLSSRIDLRENRVYTVARHVQDLEDVRRALGAQRMILVGTGWGATLATAYLLGHSAHVAKLVLESPSPVWLPAWPEFVAPTARAKMTDVQASALALLQRPTLRLLTGRMIADFSPRVAHTIIADWEADQWWTRSREEAMRLGQPRLTCASEPSAVLSPLRGLGFFTYTYTTQDALGLPDPRPALRQLETPALIMRGTCDYVDWRVSYEYLRVMPGARYVAVPAAGHLIWLEQAALHNEVLRAFLLDQSLPLAFYDPAHAAGVRADSGGVRPARP